MPSPSLQLPRPSGEIRFAEALTSVKVFTSQVPSAGGVIR
jgi:hypothetical protein